MEQANILEPLYVRQIRQGHLFSHRGYLRVWQQNLGHSSACEMASRPGRLHCGSGRLSSVIQIQLQLLAAAGFYEVRVRRSHQLNPLEQPPAAFEVALAGRTRRGNEIQGILDDELCVSHENLHESLFTICSYFSWKSIRPIICHRRGLPPDELGIILRN